MKEFSVIVSLNNNYALTSNFINILLKNTDLHNGEIVVFLDGCSDLNVIDYLRNVSDIKLIISPDKKGYSIANNLAVTNSEGKYLVFLNSDIFPTLYSVNKLVKYLDNNKNVGAVQGLLLYPQDGRVQSAGHLFCNFTSPHIYQGGRPDKLNLINPFKCQALTSAFCAIPKNVFEENGGFDEFYYNATEGLELTLKIGLSGKDCILLPKSQAYHITMATRKNVYVDYDRANNYFWAKWEQQIIDDLKLYLELQLPKEIIDDNRYRIFNLSHSNKWMDTLEELGFKKKDIKNIILPEKGKLDLLQILSYQELLDPLPIMFLVNNITCLLGNFFWIRERKNRKDCVLDLNGNFSYLWNI